MAEIIHNGAGIWDALDKGTGYHDDVLRRYFDSARERTNPEIWPLQAYALHEWSKVVAEIVEPRERRSPWDRLRNAYFGGFELLLWHPPRNCIFVSHRQCDSAKAEDLAEKILDFRVSGSNVYDVWLDVWDPALNWRPPTSHINEAVLTALIIEMGLINSVAVIALMTDDSHGSNWIPYEFGRVKVGGPFAREASVCRRDLRAPPHDYMALAPVIAYEGGKYKGLNDWLGSL